MKRADESKKKMFAEAYEKFADSLFRHCFFRVSDRERAIDLVQETFLRTWQTIERGTEVRNLKAFLYRVLNNATIDHYRKHKTDSLDALLEDEGFDPPAAGDEAVIKDAEVALLRQTLAELEEPYRGTMILRYVDGLSITEIAEILGETENVISVRLHRGAKKIKELLGYD
ncbi:RNA polymerase sigma factor [Patescibacteria group bacterium]|nr:MAG: RNA polymerase sigma factor [Patescibacteria group bacterium]